MRGDDNVPRVTQKELIAKLDNPDTLIIDVRSDKDWQASDAKIRGAVREHPKDWQNWLHKYPNDRFLIFYCA